jgi:hypothetical protein
MAQGGPWKGIALMRTRILSVLTLTLFCLGVAGSSGAGTISDFSIQVGVAGSEMTISGDTLANMSATVEEDTQTGTVTLSNGSISNGSWEFTWDSIQFNPDPFVSFVGGFTNLLTTTTDFTLITTTPIAPLGPSSLIGGSTTVSVSDANFDGIGTLANSAGLPGYSGTLDGAGALDLLDPFSLSVPFAGGTNSTTQSAGLPGPTIPDGPVAATIGITHRFSLTGSDRATFNSTFIVEIPEVGTLALMGSGFALLAWRSRRSLH